MMKLFSILILGTLVGSIHGQASFSYLQSRVTSLAQNAEREVERIHQDVSGFIVRSINDVLGQAYDSEGESVDEVMVSACNLNVVNLLNGDMKEIDDAIVRLNMKVVEFKTIIFRAIDGKSLLWEPENIQQEVDMAITEANGVLQDEIFSVIRQIATFKADTYNLIKNHRKCIANSK